MLPPWKRLWWHSCPYPVGSLPGVRTTNWSAETKFPTSYLSRARMHSLSGTCFTLDITGESLLDLPNTQDSNAGTAQVAAVASFGKITGAMIDLVPSGSTTYCGFIISWMRCMLITHFQCHNNISFWELDKFLFSLAWTQGPQNRV